MKKLTLNFILLCVFLLSSTKIEAQETIDVSSLASARAITTGSYIITGTNSGSDIASAIFTVASGNTVNITLDNVNFKTNNTATTSLISFASGSNANIIIKGTNIFDGQTLTAASNMIGFAGGGILTISQHADGGSLKMKVNATTIQFQTIGYNPTGTTGSMTIKSGTYINENTGTGVASACRVVGAGGSGAATVNIAGGTFETVGTTHSGSVLYANTTSTSLATTWNISGGTFTGVKGNVLGVQVDKIINYILSGGSFSNNNTKILFEKSTAGSIMIKAPLCTGLTINNNGSTSNLAAGATDATTIGSYSTSLTLTPVSGSSKVQYESVGTGNWSTLATWSSSADEGATWATPTTLPAYSYSSVTIKPGHTVTVDANSFTSDITVSTGGKLSLSSGKSLITSSLNISGDANGTGTIVDANANGGLFVLGSLTVNQYLSSSNSSRNWYISSPVYNAKSSVFTPASTPDVNSNCLYWYNETSGASGTWTPIVDNTTSLIAGTGYIAHLPSASYGNYTFTGSSLNSGSVNVSLTNSAVNTNFKGFNLVGNPYPSYLKWNDVSAANTGVSTTMYYKTMNGADYYVDTYNANGSQSVSASGNTITGYIPPMQAFWVYAPAATTLSLTNAMRSHADVAGNKLKAPQQAQGTSLRLRVTGGDNTDEVLLYTNAAASNNFDSYDSPKMSNANVAIPEIYCIVDGQKTVINGLNTIPFNQALPLGFSTGKSGNFTLKVAQLSNPDNDVQVWINDKTTGTNLLLSEGTAFSFSSDVVEASDRFSVIFKSASASTGVNTVGRETVNVYTNDQQQIVVNVAADSRVDVYNVAGNRVYSQLISNRENTISHSFNAGIYLVKVGTGESASIHRVIIK